ncbi:hypothetical protein N658DRAFT_285195 [Parathielavia hyrcaniae]|uniref:Uncharacterized protein n=1 Tax=Parathielavia hyrcaniae TaxID=113614 RepID=A0AAN6Q523_9PEZI|nr:hypothetical protein N658DRAFT_285195 [Parathielavia hyrcaniae]
MWEKWRVRTSPGSLRPILSRERHGMAESRADASLIVVALECFSSASWTCHFIRTGVPIATNSSSALFHLLAPPRHFPSLLPLSPLWYLSSFPLHLLFISSPSPLFPSSFVSLSSSLSSILSPPLLYYFPSSHYYHLLVESSSLFLPDAHHVPRKRTDYSPSVRAKTMRFRRSTVYTCSPSTYIS